MKVLNMNPHPSVVRQLVCKSCGSTLEYVPQDIKLRVDVSYDCSRDVVHFITCPVCNKDNYVSL